MSDAPRTLMIEGWRFIPHSYAVVNQFQCLQILQRPEIRLVHRDMPYFKPDWRPAGGLLDAGAEAVIRAIPEAAPGERPDALLRITFPYNYAPSPAQRTCVFGTAEFQCVQRSYLAGAASLQQAMRNTDFILITPSNWSRQGFIRSGADPRRVVVVPHGIDPALFHPLPDDQRAQLRAQLGWDGFVFVSLGTMAGNKGMALLLKAFATVARSHPEARLVLKGLNALYPSRDMLQAAVNTLTPAEMALVQPRLLWLQHTMSFADMARLYQAADAYVSPYFAEGFNLPVLEAAACGAIVICTSGGPTDDFTTPDFALRINSRRQRVEPERGCNGRMLQPDGAHLVHQMLAAIEKSELRARARTAGPAFATADFTWKHVTDRLLSVLFRSG